MGLFDLFHRLAQAEPGQPEETPQDNNEMEIYSGMRVEVTTFTGEMLFVAKLMSPWGNTAQLHQYSESAVPPSEDAEPIRVRIRGYHDHDRKAVYMEGTISPLPQHRWQVDELTVTRIGNDRAFFRLDTNIDASISTFGFSGGERSCKLLNISVGGAGIATEDLFGEGDKFLLKVRLLEDRDLSVMYCQVLRVIDKKDGKYEYGCRFLELNEADEAKITQNIFAAQRQKRNGSR